LGLSTLERTSEAETAEAETAEAETAEAVRRPSVVPGHGAITS